MQKGRLPMDLPLFYTILFFAVFAIYFFFSIYILHLNTKTALNRMFFAVGISLCFWSFGFAMSVNAPNAEDALGWRRVAVIGWSTLYANILLFINILVAPNRRIKYWWHYIVIYAPGILNLLVFCILNSTVSFEYHLVRVGFGWTNVAVSTIWDTIFYLYYVGYIVGCVALVWHWKRKIKDIRITRQANLIIASFVAAFILGTITDVIFAALPNPPIPQMAPIEILIPVSAFYYLIKRHGLMQEQIESSQSILSDQTRTKLFDYLAAIIMLIGIISFIYVYVFAKDSLLRAVLIAGTLILIGLLMYLVQRLKSEPLKFSLNLVLVVLSIPAVTLFFLPYGGMTSWAFPVILIIVTLVFNRRSILVAVSVSSLLTQVLLWMYAKDQRFELEPVDYLIRIAFFLVVILLGSRINKIYVSKLKENTYQIQLHKLISDISYDFAHVDKTNLDENIAKMLMKSGEFIHADRSYIFLFDIENGVMNLAYEWCRNGITHEKGLVLPIPLDRYPILKAYMASHTFVYHEDIRQYPQANIAANEMFFNKNIVSLLSTPLISSGTLFGFLGLSSTTAPIRISDSDKELLQTLGNLLSDKLMMVKTERDIEQMAYYDQLTGLPNRQLFNDRADQAIHLVRRKGHFLSVVFLDLDSFKSVNDTMGHSGGDEIIREVARTLTAHVRKSDTVARFGGDEFLILLNDIDDDDDVLTIAGNLMSLFSQPFKLSDQEYFITASAGISVYPFDGEDTETLVKNADIAMYKAKSLGSNQYVLCTSEMKAEVLNNMILTNSLYRALERGEMEVHYQPQVHLGTSAVIGVEALMRWRHPKLGMIPPGIFIPLAEKNGLINSLGEWVLRTACRQNKAWQDMGLSPFRVAVNLSAVQFRNPKLVETIDAVLRETGLDPSYLELEITESAAIMESAFIISLLKNLKQLGVTISIDDFGTEYSSLNRLKELPIDRIKIDIQFIRGLANSEKDQAITTTIINLAKNLGLRVIAEGVESATQLEFLIEKECDEVQGYYFYKPMPPEDLLKNMDTPVA